MSESGNETDMKTALRNVRSQGAALLRICTEWKLNSVTL